MQTSADIIDALGGPAALSRETGIPLTTIIGWRDANFVPPWRRAPLLALAKKLDVALKDRDFPERSQRKSRAQAAS